MLTNLYQEIYTLDSKIQDTKELLSITTDEEIIKMAKDELSMLETKKSSIEAEIEKIEQEKHNVKLDELKGDAIIEIRAGAGGNEAGLFANDMYLMYTKYALKKGYSTSELYKNEGGLGNIKEVVFEVKSNNTPTPYEVFRNEGGVHRVQRIPLTESSGRIHTSTVSVSVLPILKDVKVEIKPEDLDIDTYRATGAGGQHVNTTDSAIRITHIPTGVVVTCQDERSQHKNKEKAMDMLKSRLFEMMKFSQKQNIDELRKEHVGTAMRAEKIRTYNFPQDRITDHRINTSWHNMEKRLSGDIQDILNATSLIKMNI